MQSLERKLEMFSSLIDSVWVLGGEPLDSYGELFLNFSYYLRNVAKSKSLWLFTRREIGEVPKDSCAFLICENWSVRRAGSFPALNSTASCLRPKIKKSIPQGKYMRKNYVLDTTYSSMTRMRFSNSMTTTSSSPQPWSMSLES
jgi:hypothetical protein